MSKHNRERRASNRQRPGYGVPKPRYRDATPCTYTTHLGNPDHRDSLKGDVLRPVGSETAFAECFEENADWVVYRSPRGKVFALPLEKQDNRDKDREPSKRVQGNRLAHTRLAGGSVYLGTMLRVSRKTAVSRFNVAEALAA